MNKNILVIHSLKGLKDGTLDGSELYAISLYKNLIKYGHNANLLICKNSNLEKRVKELKIPYHSFSKTKILGITFQPGLTLKIRQLIKQNNIDIIHCNTFKEIQAAKNISKKFNRKVILTLHSTEIKKPELLNGIDGVTAVSPQVTEMANKIIATKFIPPLFNDDVYLNFKTNKTKQEFFKQEFNLKIKENVPILCMVANMYKDLEHKNHPLLFQALQTLIHKKNIPVQLVLAGSGPQENYLKKLAKDLKIDKHIYFLGFTKLIPEILYHCDIKVLTSRYEAFGIVLLEAAMFKKPIICPTNIGSSNTVIFDNKTGLLFENNKLEDLITKIEILLNNSNLRKELGNNAYNFVNENFSTNACMNKLNNFYEEIN